MRKLKFILLTIILIVCFLCEAEIFQMELGLFDAAYFRNSSFKTESEEERIELLKEVEEIANTHQIGIFYADRKEKDRCSNVLHIFCNAYAKDAIIKETNIEQGTYESLMCGITEVIYHEFSETQGYENRYINNISIAGSKRDAIKLYDEMKVKHEYTYPELYGGSQKEIMYDIWALVAVIIIVLMVIYVFFSKKEVVVRIAMGESVWRIVGQNVLFEIVQNISLYFLIRYVVFRFVSGQLMQKEIFAVYMLGTILSCLLYFAYAFYDIKIAFANASNTKGMMAGLYVAKVIVYVATVVGLSFNVTVVKENSDFLNKDKVIAKYKDYSYLFIKDNMRFSSKLSSDEEFDYEMYRSMEEIPQMLTDIYGKYYDTTKPIVCVNVLEDTSTYIVANENASSIVNEFINIDAYKEDVVVLMPKYENEAYVREETDCQIKDLCGDVQDIRKNFVKYDKDKSFTYMNQSASTGVATVANPIIIYIQNREMCKNMNVSDFEQNMLFRIDSTQAEQIQKEYMLDENGYELMVSDFMENYEYYQSFIKKILSFVSSVSVFLLLLLFVLIAIINTLEYQVNAMELAIKKVVGYSLFGKNKRMLFFSIGSDVVITIGAICCMVLMRKSVVSAVQVALIVTGLEILVCIINIYRIEKKRIVKILKGGCL